MAKQRTKGPRKKRSIRRAGVRTMKGLIMSWSAEDPLEPNCEITGTNLSHRNPVYRTMLGEIKKSIQGITDSVRLKWAVKIEVRFIDDNGKPYYRGADMVIHGILNEADGHYQEALEEIFAESNMGHYHRCDFTAEVLGDCPIKDGDFA